MSRSFRIFVAIALFGFAVWALYPSVAYYSFTSVEVKDIIEGKVSESTNKISPQLEEKVEIAQKHKKKAVKLGLDIIGGINVVIEADFDEMIRISGKTKDDLTDKFKTDAMDRVIHKLRLRIDEFGVSEVKIRKSGENRVIVRLPGEKNIGRLQDIISRVGKLEFKLVDEDATKELDWERNDKGNIVINNSDIVPNDGKIYKVKEKNEVGIYIETQPLIIKEKVEMSGNRIKDAYPQTGEYGDIVVGFSLDLKGASQFSDITGNNIGTRLAIMLDGNVMSAPKINSRIAGNGIIQGRFDIKEAKDLSIILRSGSLPVPIRIISQEVIGPSMGAEELDRSLNGLFYGLLIVICFMVIRYRLSGLIASIALIVNAIGIFAFLAPLHFTITLPGIAGLILTMGMAIDANVIIFERIREELFIEKRSVVEAIPLGFEKAWWTIMDANITSLIAAAILAYYGVGVIQGFAVVWFFGIIVSLFTSLGLSKIIFELLIYFKVIKKYSKIIV